MRTSERPALCIVRKLFVRDGCLIPEWEITVSPEGACRIVRPADVWGRERALDETVPLSESAFRAVKEEVAANPFFVFRDGVPVLAYNDSDWRVVFSFGEGLTRLHALLQSNASAR